MLRALVLLCCLALPCSALQFGVVTPARLSEAVLRAADSQAEQSRCTRDFARWMAALGSGERWALEMADSWTKSVTGLLHGNQYDLGDFDECIYASSESGIEISSSAPVIRGAYLLPQVSIESTNKSAVLSRSAQVLLQVVPLQLRVSLCVPDSCGQDLLLAALRSVAKDLLSEEGLADGFRATISLPANKLQTEANAFRPGWQHWAYLSAVAVLILLAVISTTLDRTLDASDSKDARQRWRYLLHFSLSSGMRRLLAPAPPGSMTCINGIRVLSTLWIMAGHTNQFRAPVMNSLDADNFTKALPSRMVTHYSLSVDSFLTVAGIVCCISFMRAAQKTNSFNWLKYIIHRYARTTPAVVFVTLYGATWMNIASPGADTNVQGESPTSQWYQTYWWTSLLHVSNFFADLSHLMPHTWYLSMDMQMYVLAPIVLIPLWKRPLAGKILLAFVTLTVCLVPGVLSLTYKAKIPDPPEGATNSKYYDIIMALNFRTESRMSPYVVGIAAGYFLYQIKYGGLKFQFNRVHAAGMWILIAALLNTVVFAPQSIESSSHPYNAVESFFVGFLKLAWGVAISLIIIACETGWGGPVNRILSLGAFAPLGKLSFTLYLVHFFILVVDMLYIVHSLEYYSFYVLVRKVISSVTLAVPLAAFVHLTVEQPFVLIENELWK